MKNVSDDVWEVPEQRAWNWYFYSDISDQYYARRQEGVSVEVVTILGLKVLLRETMREYEKRRS